MRVHICHQCADIFLGAKDGRIRRRVSIDSNSRLAVNGVKARQILHGFASVLLKFIYAIMSVFIHFVDDLSVGQLGMAQSHELDS